MNVEQRKYIYTYTYTSTLFSCPHVIAKRCIQPNQEGKKGRKITLISKSADISYCQGTYKYIHIYIHKYVYIYHVYIYIYQTLACNAFNHRSLSPSLSNFIYISLLPPRTLELLLLLI